MNIQAEELAQHVLTLTVKIEKDDYQAEYEEKLRKARRGMNLKGFRPGQVPMGLAKKMLGSQLRYETVQQVLERSLSDYFKEQKTLTYSRLLTNEKQAEIDPENQEDFEFLFDVGVVPELTIDPELSVELLVPTPDEAHVDERIEENQMLFAPIEEAESIGEKSIVAADWEALTTDGKALEEPLLLKGRNFPMEQVDESQRKLLEGKKVGETVEIESLQAFFPEESFRMRCLHPTEEEQAKLSDRFKVSIVGIQERGKAELNTNFFSRFVDPPKGGQLPEDPAEVRKLYHEQLLRSTTFNGQLNAGRQLFDQLLEAWDFTIPEPFLERISKDLLESEEIASYLEEVRQHIRRDALSQRLFIKKLDDENRPEDEEEFRTFIASSMIASRMIDMGLPSYLFQSVQSTLYFGNSLIKDEGFADELKRTEERFLGCRWALDHVKVNRKEVALGEFNKVLAEREEKEAAKEEKKAAKTKKKPTSRKKATPKDEKTEE